jgi:hypothetical protein
MTEKFSELQKNPIFWCVRRLSVYRVCIHKLSVYKVHTIRGLSVYREHTVDKIMEICG